MGWLPSVYPNFVLHRSAGCKIWFEPNYAGPAVLALLKNPDGLFDLFAATLHVEQRLHRDLGTRAHRVSHEGT